MWPFLMLTLCCGVVAAALVVKAIASWSAHHRLRSCLQVMTALPLACVFALSLLQFWQKPLDFFYQATGFPAGWHCSYASRGEPICIKNN